MAFLIALGGGFAQYLLTHFLTSNSKSNQIASEALDFTGLLAIEGRYTLHISGEQYDGRQSAIWRLRVGQKLLLRREPWNKHDPQAVAVSTLSGDVIGYIPRKNAGWVSRLLDQGDQLKASVAHVFDDDGDSVLDVQIHIDGVPPLGREKPKRRPAATRTVKLRSLPLILTSSLTCSALLLAGDATAVSPYMRCLDADNPSLKLLICQQVISEVEAIERGAVFDQIAGAHFQLKHYEAALRFAEKSREEVQEYNRTHMNNCDDALPKYRAMCLTSPAVRLSVAHETIGSYGEVLALLNLSRGDDINAVSYARMALANYSLSIVAWRDNRSAYASRGKLYKRICEREKAEADFEIARRIAEGLGIEQEAKEYEEEARTSQLECNDKWIKLLRKDD